MYNGDAQCTLKELVAQMGREFYMKTFFLSSLKNNFVSYLYMGGRQENKSYNSLLW